MARDGGKTNYKQAFIARVKRAREGRGLTQAEMAELLDMEQGKYKQYETRTYLPHDLIHRFCLATGIDEPWLFTEHGREPMKAQAPQQPAKKQRIKAARKVA